MELSGGEGEKSIIDGDVANKGPELGGCDSTGAPEMSITEVRGMELESPSPEKATGDAKREGEGGG
uniref:Uncharacterized protein n=1 Tax=Leersia perrieri TaxID=77586 RepID=A0A0D9W2A9_9ORYZ